MLFSDPSFWVFFAGVVALYVMLPHRWQNRMLLVASYVFYSAWDWRFLSLIIISTVTDYIIGKRLHEEIREKHRLRYLLMSLAVNLGILGIFKYFNFFAGSFVGLLAPLGITPNDLTLNIILPVGISFYTFQTISYTFDIYRKQLKPCHNFLDFALFVAFFPQLVAGPIERARNLIPNVVNPRTLSWDKTGRGVVLCLIGLIKKVVIADAISGIVDGVYGPGDPSSAAVYMATVLFAVQIYCDFSGYTDIARGISKILGFELMRNFAQPYFSTSPQSFWRRWHISLSTWLRDYLYIPLGGNRGSETKTYRNLILTMLLGGLWHGAAWTFVAWGLFHGGMLAVHRRFGAILETPAQLGKLGQTILKTGKLIVFFHLTLYGWLLFRAVSFEQVASFSGKLLNLPAWASDLSVFASVPTSALIGVVFILSWDLITEVTGKIRFYEEWPLFVRAALYAGMIYLLAFGATPATGDFIYFQF